MKYMVSLFMMLFFTSNALGQRLKTPTLSPYSEIKQEIGLTEISIQYARPSAKGRTVMGELVPFGKLWRTGANASTKIILSEETKIGGHPVPTGTYALYTIPGEKEWTIIIHGNTTHRSVAGDVYKQEEDICRFTLNPIHQPTYEETFTLQFTDITTTGCNIKLSWENTMILIPVEVNVDCNVEAQIASFMEDMENVSDRALFESAQYYLHNDKDQVKALKWIDLALTKSPKNFRYGLLKAKILEKSGQHDEAISTINQAHQWAVDANNANYMEQTQIYKKQISKN